ncbi:MAG: HAMP domain-containing protein [Giesbergeria sp.]|nr:HAMP domain-containing protein [Giesbergeria sp.]
MHLNNVRMGRKLWSILLGLVLAMLALGLGLLVYITKVDFEVAQNVQFSEDRISLALRWKGMTQLSTERAMVAATSSDDRLVQKMQQLVQSDIAGITEMQKKVEAVVVTAEGQRELEAVAAKRTQVLKYFALAQQARESGDIEGARQVVDNQMRPAVVQYIASLEMLVDRQELLRDQAKSNGKLQRRTANWSGVGLAAALFMLAMGLAVVMVRSITQPLQRAVDLADRIASGDLTASADDERKDELGHLLRSLTAMAARLRSVVGEVRSGVESVSSASTQIAMGNQDLSARTEQTAANLEETAASMEELTATVSQSADTARQANQLAANAAQAATRGGEVVGQVVSSMQQITDSSRKISDIIGVIDSIAFQTNILALNAAVEAARAGEQGRGFAVVASEVRNLAGRSADAAKEIKALIDASVQNVETGSQQVAQAGASMTEIVTGVQRVSDLIGEITAAATEQRDGIAQVNQAVTNLDQMTQQNAALVEESTAAATAMRDQAQHLSQVVSVFNVGASAAPSGNAAAVRARLAPAPKPTAQPALKPKPAAPRPAVAAAPRPASAPRVVPAPRLPAAPRPATPAADDDWESF